MTTQETQKEAAPQAASKAPARARAAVKEAAEAKSLTHEELVQTIKRMTVVELAELVKTLEAELGVTASPAMAVAATPAAAVAAPVEEEKTEFTIRLKEIGANKINVIKAVREVTALGLKEAKDLVEAAPKAVKEGISKAEAQAIKEKLEGAGAKADIL